MSVSTLTVSFCTQGLGATGSINKYLQAMSLEDVIEEPEEQLECEKNKKKQTPDSQHTSPTANSTPVSALQKELASWKAKNKELETKLNVLIRLRDYLRMTQAELLSTNLPKHTGKLL
ncbi:hypothetical protein B566_EDAN002508 [Ephemera danica]|nr:hypothetical protein B566_EDAN002508 [Ephemera danica]